MKLFANEITEARFEANLDIRRNLEAVKRDGARVEAILTAPYHVAFRWRDRRWSLTVPAGFLAAPSVPPILHGIVPFWGALFEASIVHDWCYWTRCFDPLCEGDGRRRADLLLAALMHAGGADLGDCLEVFTAVRAAGGKNYAACTFKPGNNLAEVPA